MADKKLRSGLFLILIGLFITLAPVPFASGYHSKSGLIFNIQQMEIVVLEEKRKPTFSTVEEISKSSKTVKIKGVYSDGELVMIEFPPEMSDDEIKQVLNTEFPHTHIVKKYPPKMKFDGWKTVRQQIAIPYKYPFTGGVILVFWGIGMLILASTRTSERGY